MRGDFSIRNDNDKNYRSRFQIDVILNQILREILLNITSLNCMLKEANNDLTFLIQIYDIHTDFLDALHEKFGVRYEFKIDYGERIIRRLRFKADFFIQNKTHIHQNTLINFVIYKMDEDKNVNNIKRHQEKALLWRMVSYHYNTIDKLIIV